MNWLDGRDSCTCSCTLTGLPAQIPTELRRGSANKTRTVILEVPTCLNQNILTIPYSLFHIIMLLLLNCIATLHYVACFPISDFADYIYCYFIIMSYTYLYEYIYSKVNELVASLWVQQRHSYTLCCCFLLALTLLLAIS